MLRADAQMRYNDSVDGEHYQEHYEHFRWYTGRGFSEEEVPKVYFR